MNELRAIVDALLAPNAPPAVLATLVTVEGSSYRRPGARLLVTQEGRRLGSISGGCLEADVMARAVQIRTTGQPATVTYDTTSENDLIWGVGLGCHGIVRVLLESVPPRPAWATALAQSFARRRPTALAVRYGTADPDDWGTQLASPGDCADPEHLFLDLIPPPVALTIFGAGDDAQPLARLASELGWQVTVADPRPEFATIARFPGVHTCVVAPAEDLVRQVAPGSDTLTVVMTHHYVHDVPLLRDLLNRPLAYLGLLGPRKRAEKILADLARGGTVISDQKRAQLHAPVGLDLGADAPSEVALAIIAEMLATLRRRDARPLRERTQPIHE